MGTEITAQKRRWIGCKEAADLIGVSRATITRQCQTGRLKAVNTSPDAKRGVWRIDRASFMQLYGLEG